MVHAGSPEMENLYSLPLDNGETALVCYFSQVNVQGEMVNWK